MCLQGRLNSRISILKGMLNHKPLSGCPGMNSNSLIKLSGLVWDLATKDVNLRKTFFHQKIFTDYHWHEMKQSDEFLNLKAPPWVYKIRPSKFGNGWELQWRQILEKINAVGREKCTFLCFFCSAKPLHLAKAFVLKKEYQYWCG